MTKLRIQLSAEAPKLDTQSTQVVPVLTHHGRLLLAEAEDAPSLSRGVQRLASRIARRVNLLVGRRGRLWRERYHRRDLSTPRQFRNALVYVIMNFRKHAPGSERAHRGQVVDGHSSALWLDGWRDDALREPAPPKDLRYTSQRDGGTST